MTNSGMTKPPILSDKHHASNQLAQVEGDFEKGAQDGVHDALEVVRRAANRLGLG